MARTRAAGGLAPVDLARFWSDQDRAFANPFGIDIPQVPLGVLMSRECVFAELEIPETPANWHRLLHDAAWAAQVSRAYNDKAEQIVGRRLLSETSPDPERTCPPVKQLHDIFEATNIWHNESYWLQQSAHGETEPPEGDMLTHEARAAWQDKFIWQNINLNWYEMPPGELKRNLIRVIEAAGRKRHCLMISEEVPQNWRKSVPFILSNFDSLEI